MTSGPLGAPRPFTDIILIADFKEEKLKIGQVGPLGVVRPFAKPNPDVPEERVRECIMSEAGISFGVGARTYGGLDFDDFEELPPEQRVNVLRRVENTTRKWCEGMLSSTSMPELEDHEISSLYDAIIEGELEQAVNELEELPEDDVERVIDI